MQLLEAHISRLVPMGVVLRIKQKAVEKSERAFDLEDNKMRWKRVRTFWMRHMRGSILDVVMRQWKILMYIARECRRGDRHHQMWWLRVALRRLHRHMHVRKFLTASGAIAVQWHAKVLQRKMLLRWYMDTVAEKQITRQVGDKAWVVAMLRRDALCAPRTACRHCTARAMDGVFLRRCWRRRSLSASGCSSPSTLRRGR